MSLEHRFVWTWDHSMDWSPLADGLQEFGCFNPYFRTEADFIDDYKRAIDFYAPLGVTGIVVYGLFRDCHGGVKAAQEICSYARKQGTMILAGIGVNAYGGIYWEGDHEFNLPTWLDKHPELAAKRPCPIPSLRMACPSKKENHAWHMRAIKWLCENVDIGGINFESGDYGLCECPQCVKRYGNKYFSVGHMTEFFNPLVEQARRVRPDIVSLCECYFDHLHEPAHYAPLKDLDSRAILQFCINYDYLPRFLKEIDSKAVAALPPHRKVIRTHIGTQWNGQRHKLVAKEFGQIAAHAAEIGMDGTTIFGEVSATKTVHEINYLAAAAFADNPRLTWPRFVADVLGPKFGGPALAAKYVQILGKKTATPADVKFVESNMAKSRPDTRRRWLWLREQLYRRADK